MHSGFVLIPVVRGEDNQYSIINARKLSPWFQFPGTLLSQQDSLEVTTTPGYGVAEYALMAASNGYVAFVPQKTGFGASSELVPTELVKKSIVTSSLPLYAWVEKYIRQETNGMTSLDNRAVYAGYSSGGFAAVAAADGFKKHGIRPNQVLASTLPARLESWTIMGIVRSISNDIFSNNSLATIAASTIGLNVVDSNLIPYYQNAYPTLTWGVEGDEGELPSTNNLDPEVYAHFKAALDNGIEDPCGKTGMGYPTYTGNVAYVCMAATENSLTKIIEKAKYPIDICMWQTDKLIVIENKVEPKNGKFVELFSDKGNHLSGSFFCAFELFKGFEMNPEGTKTPKAMKGSKAPKSMKGTKSPKRTKTPKSSETGGVPV